MTRVRVPPWDFDVNVDEDGLVGHNNRIIGRVWKGTRTYSPPTHKGSRTVKYHKQVPTWHYSSKNVFLSEGHADTRIEAIQQLLLKFDRSGGLQSKDREV